MIWNREIIEPVDLLLPNYFCGYVELLPEDYYYAYPDDAESELEVFGGITYTGTRWTVPALPANKRFVGFDTAHAFQPHYTLDTVKQDCFSLIDQIIERNYDTPAWVLC